MAENENPKGGEVALIKVGLDTGEAEQQGAALGKTLQGVGKNIGEQSVKSFKAQLREAREEALRLAAAGDTSSAAFVKARDKIAELKDAADVLGRSVQAADFGNKFQALNKVAGLAASSLGGLTGAMTLFGVSTESANEQIARLQSISSVVQLIDAWGDSIDFLQPFLQRIGLISVATEGQIVAQTEQVAATEAQIAAAQQATIAENDLIIANLAAAKSAEAKALAETTAESARLKSIGTTETEIIAEQEATIAKLEGATASKATTVALEAQTVATTGASVASKVLKVALASIGIGLLISAIAYLVENWQAVKKSVTDLFPALDGAGAMFTKIKNIAVGVGNVIVQYLISPFKVLGKVLSGDFKGAMLEFQNGLDVVKNFKSGQLIGEVADAKRRNKEILEDDIKNYEQRIKVLKAAGKNTDALERAQYLRKVELYKDDEKKYIETINEKEIFEAGIIKKQADEAKKLSDKAKADAKAKADKDKADRKAQLKEYEKFIEDARKVTEQSTKNERDKAEDDVRLKYEKELKLADKLGKSKIDIEKAQAAELLIINKKYADDVATYLTGKDAEKLNSFDKQRKQINDEIEKLKLTASADDKVKLDNSKANQLSSIDNLENATNSSTAANTNLNTVKTNNEANEKDKIEVARQKVLNIRNAELSAELEAFNLKKLQLAGQKTELEQLEKDHSDKLLSINSETTKANLELSDKEKKQKIDNLQAVSNMLGNAAAIFGENTVAYKAFAVAQAGIDTYLSAQSAYKSMVGIPVVGPALATAAAGIAVVGGLANIKKIVSVKVPNVANSSSSIAGLSSASAFSAPVINSTILKQSDSGIAGLTDTVATKQENLRAFVVADDINKLNQKTKVYDNLSTI